MIDSYLLTNKKGGFYFNALDSPFTKFNGLFFPYIKSKKTKEWDMRKTIEFIGIPEKTDIIHNELAYINLKKQNSSENIFLNHSNTLIYEVENYKGPVTVTLDAKNIYDDSPEGRIYKISRSQGCVIITYEKYSDDSLTHLEYKFYMAFKSDIPATYLEDWMHRYYPLDEQRGDNPNKWVFNALQFNCKMKGRIVMSYSEKRKEAIQKAKEVFENSIYIKRMKKKYVESLSSTHLNLKGNELKAYQNAVINFDNLIQEIGEFKGIFAGLPWFFHFWSRDEAISSIALIKEEHYDLAKTILLRWLNISSDSRVPNRFPAAGLGSADATGWIFFRLKELLEALKEKNKLNDYFSKPELYYIFKECKRRVANIEEKYMKNGLIYNAPLETWMDTGAEVGDLRDGFRIEIQALHLSMYNFILYLGKLLQENVENYDILKEDLITQIRASFYKDGYLFDSPDDPQKRPNAFIAAYIAPEILSKKEWVGCIQKLLDALYSPENGGILTIPENSSLFCELHTGANNHSYHRGDVWYWLNNLVAIVLSRYGKMKFKKYIASIKNSAIDEMFDSGCISCMAEISSAKKLTSQGCISQAWSYALFIELLYT